MPINSHLDIPTENKSSPLDCSETASLLGTKPLSDMRSASVGISIVSLSLSDSIDKPTILAKAMIKLLLSLHFLLL